MTNMASLYAVPYVCPAVQVDVPGQGVPSDHDMAVALPLSEAGAGAVTREYTTRVSRPLPESQIREFGQWISQENWETLKGSPSTSEQAQILKLITEQQLNRFFPVKECRVTNTDKPWVTRELKKLDRWKKAEYKKNGKSNKYIGLLQSYNQKFKNASKKHLKRNVTDLMQRHQAGPGTHSKGWGPNLASVGAMGASH